MQEAIAYCYTDPLLEISAMFIQGISCPFAFFPRSVHTAVRQTFVLVFLSKTVT